MSKRWPVDEHSFENNKLIQPWPTVATLVKGECLWVTGQSKFWYASCPVTRARQVNFIGEKFKARQAQRELSKESLQLRVLRFGFLQDGNIGIGVFPERKEIIVGGCCLASVPGHGGGSA